MSRAGWYREKYPATFSNLGVKEIVELYVDEREQAVHAEKVKLLDGVNAVFFSGGDQLRITSQIAEKPISERVHEIFASGGVIAGTSAGASVMSEPMLVRGPNAPSFRMGDLGMAPGLGLLPDVIIDQYFAERGRIGRLIGAVSQNPRVLGISIDEDTAIVVEGQKFRVIASGAVLAPPTRTSPRPPQLSALHLRPETARVETGRRIRHRSAPACPSVGARATPARLDHPSLSYTSVGLFPIPLGTRRKQSC
ncbi:cyanophycinase [Sinorhizobium medicae]|uniref:cyanophycinase n=1 Tax=Sinorhizobium medicae TaxID=110321 RepID=UPI001E07846D|nr:cyanophycinase [Sinorhizobium medicae]PLU12997.1 cyanophycinase [Sinorhizobium medicae]PLU43695.1 cyanophycinase [Sinorhizobium medicae]PLU63861.1 cyanophycinase [Sinorhizobium medicae]PLU66412.1 cyanophycinase [Sinorhizobium medicae]